MSSTTAATTAATSDSPIPTATGGGIAIGGRAAEVFVPLEDFEYLDPPPQVLDRFTSGFAAQGAAAGVVESIAAKTVVPVGGGADEGAVVVSIAIDEAVGPLADGFREGVLSSITAQGAAEEIDLGGTAATFVDTGEQQALYVQRATTVLFFIGAAGREPLTAVATALLPSVVER